MNPTIATAAKRTLAFYQGHAEAYAAASAGVSMIRHGRSFALRLPRGGRVLDLGCGSGRDLSMLRSFGLDPVGLDYVGSLARAAVARSHERVVVGDLRQLPFVPASFHGVWASASLLHVDRTEILDTLLEARRALRPGGVLFASVKLGAGLLEEQDRTFTLYEADEWPTLLRSAGFSDVSVDVEEESRLTLDPDPAPQAQRVRWLASFARLR